MFDPSLNNILLRRGLQGRHEPRLMVSKPLDSQMSIKIDPALPISFRIDIKLVMFKTFRKNIQYFNSFTIFLDIQENPAELFKIKHFLLKMLFIFSIISILTL